MAHAHVLTTALATLLCAQVCAEWVEISQQHYRKPIRTHHPFTTPDELTDVEETTKPWTYSNRSVAKYNWNNSKPRTPNIGNFKRVQHVGDTVRTTDRFKFEDKGTNLDEELEVKLRPDYEVTKIDTESTGKHSQKDIIQRVPNISNGNRVYVGSNPTITESKFEDEELNFDADIVDFELGPYSSTSTGLQKYNKRKGTSEKGHNNKANRIYVGSTVKTTKRIKTENQKPDLDEDFSDYELKPHTKTSTELNVYRKQKGAIERIPNIGNVKRVDLNDSPVKSPAIQKGDREISSSESHGIRLHSDGLQTKVFEFNHNKNLESFNQRIYVEKVKKQQSDERTATFPPDDKETIYADVTMLNKKNYKEDLINYTTTKDLYLNKPTVITDLENSSTYETQRNNNFKNNNEKITKVNKENNIRTTKVTDIGENIITKIKMKPNHVLEIDKEQENLISNDRPNTKVSHITFQQDADAETLNQKTDTLNVTTTNLNKETTMENFIKFIKVVADTISKNSRRSFGGKMQYLHELKDSILSNIEERIESTWPDDDSPGARRRSRSAHATGRGHVHFPSSESSLMTISFLTFAVFLIKLVLQVIQTYKNKTMMVAPLVVAAAGRNVFSHHGHH